MAEAGLRSLSKPAWSVLWVIPCVSVEVDLCSCTWLGQVLPSNGAAAVPAGRWLHSQFSVIGEASWAPACSSLESGDRRMSSLLMTINRILLNCNYFNKDKKKKVHMWIKSALVTVTHIGQKKSEYLQFMVNKLLRWLEKHYINTIHCN